MFKYEVGQQVKILEGIRSGEVDTIEDREMSSGKISIPRYYIKGRWYYEDELLAL